MDFDNIKRKLEQYQAEGKQVFTSSSFQTHSIVLLHILSRIDRSIPVYFINTGFHFPETLMFRDEISDRLGLNLIDLKTPVSKSQQLDQDNQFFYSSDPDYCCFLNKTAPMQSVLKEYDVWINGVRGDQSAVRKAMQVEQPAPHNSLRFHPMLDWNAKSIYQYRKEFDLPEHPLDAQGYMSIGCAPCTRKLDPEMQEREARWYGMNKTECGLHTDLIKK
ncbi:phosphoadenylyl-sulfate reductase [Persicobacter psychrovividus]|uniref:Adenosine 5'-phosphosulfate reductase n=1 Tax=Persicobacter psychrovividus TaxID=387638 RepID=A0ABM7VCN0_9BACT|nr:phosphoadenylyl-sulfate reductase [Persicobacter psychrovividus]